METIFHQLLINASNEQVYNAIVKKEGISKWWIADCMVKNRVGYINHFRNDGYMDTKMLITILIPNELIEWKCIDGVDDWIGTYVVFEISELNGHTKLGFKQKNWSEQNDFFATCNFYWARQLIKLKDYCEKGESQLSLKEELDEVKKYTY